MKPNDNHPYTVSQVAALLDLTEQTIYDYIKQNKFKTLPNKWGRNIMITAESYNEFIGEK